MIIEKLLPGDSWDSIFPMRQRKSNNCFNIMEYKLDDFRVQFASTSDLYPVTRNTAVGGLPFSVHYWSEVFNLWPKVVS